MSLNEIQLNYFSPGTEFVEPAPLGPCVKLVSDMKKEDLAKEIARKEAEKRKRIDEAVNKLAEERKRRDSNIPS